MAIHLHLSVDTGTQLCAHTVLIYPPRVSMTGPVPSGSWIGRSAVPAMHLSALSTGAILKAVGSPRDERALSAVDDGDRVVRMGQ